MTDWRLEREGKFGEKTMTGRAMGWSLVAAAVSFFVVGSSAVAYQRNTTPINPPSYASPDNNNTFPRTSPADSQSAFLLLQEKRGKALSIERQRMMTKDADQLVQAAADLQASVNKGIDGGLAREEQAKRAEAIEKLAKDVKERMKGDR